MGKNMQYASLAKEGWMPDLNASMSIYTMNEAKM